MQFLHNFFTFFHVLCLFHSSNAKLKKFQINPHHICQIIQYHNNPQSEEVQRQTQISEPSKWASSQILAPKHSYGREEHKIKQPPFSPFLSIPFLSNKPDTNAINNLHKPHTKQPKKIHFFPFFVAESWENKKKMVDIHGFEGKISWETEGKLMGLTCLAAEESEGKLRFRGASSKLKAYGLGWLLLSLCFWKFSQVSLWVSDWRTLLLFSPSSPPATFFLLKN